MAQYHHRKRTEEQLLISQEEEPHHIKAKSTFKLFTKTNHHTINNMNVLELDESDQGRGKGEAGQLIQ